MKMSQVDNSVVCIAATAKDDQHDQEKADQSLIEDPLEGILKSKTASVAPSETTSSLRSSSRRSVQRPVGRVTIQESIPTPISGGALCVQTSAVSVTLGTSMIANGTRIVYTSTANAKVSATQSPTQMVVRKTSTIASLRRGGKSSSIVRSGPDLETIVTEYSVPPFSDTHFAAHRLDACRPLAILLRFRVAQIVSGSCTFLLGCVALLDDATRGTLSFALIAGVLCVVTASLHTADCRKRGTAGLEYICPGLHVTAFVIITIVTNIILLLIDALCICRSSNRNSFKLGIAQGLTSLPWNLIEFTTLALRVVWARRVTR